MSCDGIKRVEGFCVLDPTQYKNTLANKLIGVADSLRDLNTKFGGRPYIVRIIRTLWTEGRRGIGEEVLTFERLILPTPLVSDLSGIAEILQPVGMAEDGGVSVSQISGRYTEEELRGFDAEGHPPNLDEKFWWEIEFPRLNGHSVKRRFSLRAQPNYSAFGFQWSVILETVDQERTRAGDLRG